MKTFLNIFKKSLISFTKFCSLQKSNTIISVKDCQGAKVHVLHESLIAARKDFNNSLEYPKS